MKNVTEIIADEYIKNPFMLYQSVDFYCKDRNEMESIKKIIKTNNYTDINIRFTFKN
jgi:hypothetical protein